MPCILTPAGILCDLLEPQTAIGALHIGDAVGASAAQVFLVQVDAVRQGAEPHVQFHRLLEQ